MQVSGWKVVQAAKVVDGSDSDTQHTFELARDTLYLMEFLGSIGRKVVQIGSRKIKHPNQELDEYGGDALSARFNMEEMVDLLWRAHILSISDHGKQTPKPWLIQSAYLTLKLDFDDVLIRFPDKDGHEEDRIAQETDTSKHLLCYLASQCGILLMNRVFLPIQVCIGPPHSSEEARRSSSSLVDVEFPGAPRPFVRERTFSCLASASKITDLCNQALCKGVFKLVSYFSRAVLSHGL